MRMQMKLNERVPTVRMVMYNTGGTDNRDAMNYYLRTWYNKNPVHFMDVVCVILIDAGILDEGTEDAT